MRYLARYALVGPGEIVENALITTEGARITSVSVNNAGVTGSAVVLGGLVTPGFSNCHSHAFHRLLRGRTNSEGGDFWSWQQLMYRAAERVDPDNYRELATLVYLEMVKAGFTSVGEFHYLHHDRSGNSYSDPNEMGYALRDAAESVGIRLGLLDACYLHGGLGPGGYLEPTDAQQRFSDGTVERYLRRVESIREGEDFRVSRAVHSVRAVNAKEMAEIFSASDLVHLHLSEQQAENDRCFAYFERSPLELVGDCGGLHAGTTLVHANHLSESDLMVLEGSGATVCACPSTEEDLGDGFAPVARFVDQQTRVSVGTDQNVVVDPFFEASQLENHERLSKMERGVLSPVQLWSSLLAHDSLGFSDAGQLAPGMRADLVEIDLESIRTYGSSPSEVIMSASAADVRTVIVAGKPIVTNFHHPLEDSLAQIYRSLGPLFTD